MKVDALAEAAFRSALGEVDCSALGLKSIAYFPGATAWSRRSSVACRFNAASAALPLLETSVRRAAALAGERLGIGLNCGVEAGPEEHLCWVEYFPGGARHDSAALSLHCLRAALVSEAAKRTADPSCGGRAQKEAAALAQVPAQQIFLQSRFLIETARACDIPVLNIAGAHLGWQFGWGSRAELFFMTASTGDSVPGHQITTRKSFTKVLLRELGLPTPDWRLASSAADALRAAEEIGWPCVVKPVAGAFGKGVTAGVRSVAELKQAVALAAAQGRGPILIERQEAGADHRLMVVDGRLVRASRRDPPAITGDGRKTIGQLIDALNRGRDGSKAAGYLQPVELDAALQARLKSNALTLDSVLARGRTFALRTVANHSAGGSAADVTGLAHPQVRGMAEQLAVSLGLRTAGIDYITMDISRSYSDVGGGFIEVNAMPRLRLLMTAEGAEQEIGSALLGSRPGRIPLTLVLGDAEVLEEMAGRVRAHCAALADCAAVSKDWAQVGATELPAHGLDPMGLVFAVLRCRSADRAWVLWTPEQAAEFGLPADQFVRAVSIADSLGKVGWIERYCEEVVPAGDAASAIAAALA
jgi:D-alanine-D-alanine ligase-like ATP-grasp enzyme